MGIGVVMKKKVKTILFVFIIIGVIILNITYKNKNEVTKTKRKKQNNLAIMIKEDGATDYTKASSKDIPKGNYVLNRDKSYCKNNGVIGDYDSTLGKISFSFIGTDSCYLYFDEVGLPIIKNLNYDGEYINATIISKYPISYLGISLEENQEPDTYFFDPSSYCEDLYSCEIKASLEYDFSLESLNYDNYYLYVYNENGDYSVSSFNINTEEKTDIILLNNGDGATTVADAKTYIKGKGTPDFSKISITNDGLYAMNDDLGTSYYFRGAVDNNWVKFGKDSSGKDMYWRIIRINGDGSIRMIYSGTSAPTESTKVIMTGTGTQIGTSKYYEYYNFSEYVGYMYAKGEQHGTSHNSTIKTTLDNWYANTTLNTDAKALVSDQIFCNDRNIGSGTWSSYGSNFLYLAMQRLSENSGTILPNPTLKCTTIEDRFTVSGSKGNGTLTYPVGLITSDEIALAGGLLDESNSNFYLYSAISYVTMSPYSWGGYAGIFYYNEDTLMSGRTDGNFSVRPVINLSSEAKLSGEGTWNNVYIVN